MLGLDPGFAAGLVSGALTESPAMGTATEAINSLPLPEAQRALYVAHIAVADAVCYLFGAVFVILFCAQLGPALLKVDLKREALDLERAYGIERTKAGLFSAWRRFELRAYRLPENSRVAGLCVSAAEAEVPDHRLFVQRIRRGDDIIEAEPGLMLQAGDVVAIAGPRDILVELLGRGPQEVEDRQLLDVPVAAVQVLLTNRDLVGRSLAELAQGEWTRSLYLREVTRGGEKIPAGSRHHARARGFAAGGRAGDGGHARGLSDRAGGRAHDVHGLRYARSGHLPWRTNRGAGYVPNRRHEDLAQYKRRVRC